MARGTTIEVGDIVTIKDKEIDRVLTETRGKGVWEARRGRRYIVTFQSWYEPRAGAAGLACRLTEYRRGAPANRHNADSPDDVTVMASNLVLVVKANYRWFGWQ